MFDLPDLIMPKRVVLISACLCGENCRYDGGNSRIEELARLRDAGRALAVCPERDGGLTVPRPPCEIKAGRALTQDGLDCTAAFLAGAERALELARRHGISYAILKDKSPSCGSRSIYDGSFTGRLTAGQGLAAGLLARAGLRLFCEDDYRAIYSTLTTL